MAPIRQKKGYEIVLDCSPGDPRPDELIDNALVNTPLNGGDFTVIGKLFGAWTFQAAEDKIDLCFANHEQIGTNVKDLYHHGLIRYGEWTKIEDDVRDNRYPDS